MLKRNFSTTIVLIATAIALVCAVSLRAQVTARLITGTGDISTPTGRLKPGDSVPFDVRIQTAADALAIIRMTWPVSNGTCASEIVFGFGDSHELRRPMGGCFPSASTGVTSVSYKTGYADNKGDVSPVDVAPAVVAAFGEFDQLLKAVSKGMSPLRLNENRNAADYRSFKAQSAAACSAACANESQCNAMTFIKSNGLCYLKTERGTAQSHGDMISAVRRINPKALVGRGQ